MLIEKLNYYKKKKGLTNQQLADFSGVTLSTLDKLTSGINVNPKLSTLQSICDVFECSLDDLLGKNEPNEQKKLPESEERASEQTHIQKYRLLNPDGQRRVDEYTDDLVHSGKYKKDVPQNKTAIKAAARSRDHHLVEGEEIDGSIFDRPPTHDPADDMD